MLYRQLVIAFSLLSTVATIPFNATASPTKTFTLTIQTFTAAPDGYQANVYGANGVMDYPIIVNRGDNVIINVNNLLDEPTSIHCHGLLQNGTNWYDGPAGITQCPIPPEGSFSYKFAVTEQHGTYWWHSHYKAQYTKGIRGPLIVRDPKNEPYTDLYDDEKVLLLADWFHARSSHDIYIPLLNSSTGADRMPDSGLINGKGRYNCTKVVDGTPCDPNASREVISFTPGKRYRLRIINGSAQAAFNFSIDGHRMQVIEADGIDTQLTSVDAVRLSPGQRYSVIVNADAAPGNFWMRATMDTKSYFRLDPNAFDPNVLGIVSYTGDCHEPTTSGPPADAVYVDQFRLVVYKTMNIPSAPDMTLALSFAVRPNQDNLVRAFVSVDGYFNSSTYATHEGLSALNQVAAGMDVTGTSLNTVTLPPRKTVDMIIYNHGAIEHPFHLHGYSFQIVGSGLLYGDNPIPVPQPGPGPYPERDTVVAPACIVDPGNKPGDCGKSRGYVIIRFYTDNPGLWLMHCHIEWHVVQGLALTLLVDQESVRQRGVPSDVYGLCPPVDSNTNMNDLSH